MLIGNDLGSGSHADLHHLLLRATLKMVATTRRPPSGSRPVTQIAIAEFLSPWTCYEVYSIISRHQMLLCDTLSQLATRNLVVILIVILIFVVGGISGFGLLIFVVTMFILHVCVALIRASVAFKPYDVILVFVAPTIEAKGFFPFDFRVVAFITVGLVITFYRFWVAGFNATPKSACIFLLSCNEGIPVVDFRLTNVIRESRPCGEFHATLLFSVLGLVTVWVQDDNLFLTDKGPTDLLVSIPGRFGVVVPSTVLAVEVSCTFVLLVMLF